MSAGNDDIHFPDTSEKAAVTKTSGRVKWFNNKSGYGFITVTTGEHSDSDIFVHHSAVKVEKEQYRYLVQGEYVDFVLKEVTDSTHRWQACDVSGISGGKLMCETRLETRVSRGESGKTPTTTSVKSSRSSSYRVRPQGPGPREGDEWMLVRRRAAGGSGSGTQEYASNRSRPSRSNKD